MVTKIVRKLLVGFVLCGLAALAAGPSLTVYLAPNTHGTVSGWLVDFDSERSHVVNNYLNHMDRVATDPNYAMAFSEVPNLMVLMQFTPQGMAQLQQQVKDRRTELVNGFFLEPSISLSGGEALVRMGVLGLRWYDEVFGKRPRFSWMIDVCGTHRQMPQIVSGLGLEALFFSRDNPAPQSAFWWRSPDGSRTMAVCLGRGYSSTSRLFKTKEPLSDAEMKRMYDFFIEDRKMSPSQTSIFVPVGGGDYSLAPKRTTYPSELMAAWQRQYPDIKLRFSVPGAYVDALKQEIRQGATRLTEYMGDTVHSYNAFWMNMPEIKRGYRRSEHALQASEMLATVGSLQAGAPYPSETLYNAWLMMLMNMDRNVLWGAGAGAPFHDPKHWNVQDRFDYVDRHAGKILSDGLSALTREGRGIALFNPLNWDREDPIEIAVPPGTRPSGLRCEVRGERTLCVVHQPSTGVRSIPIESGAAPAAVDVPFEETVETKAYTVKFDRATGAMISLRDRASGKEYLGGPANVIQAESVAGIVKDPANWMAQRAKRKLVDSSSNHKVKWQVSRGPLATTLVASSGFIGGSTIERRVTLYNDYPRIDFDTTIDLHSPDTLVTADFPLPGEVVERTRGIPYGFSSVDPRNVARPLDYFLAADQKLYGFSDALAPSVRWSDYAFAEGGGLALLDRGLTCHEFEGHTITLALVNAQSSYRGLPNEVLAGQGVRKFSYAIWPHMGTWQQARIPRHAWEFNSSVVAQPGRVVEGEKRFLTTSPNVIVEAMRRVGKDIEIRLAESNGVAGQAEVSLKLPHSLARRTNLMGEQAQALRGDAGTYRLSVKPQQIITLRFAVSKSVAATPAIRAWDALIPPGKLDAYRRRQDLKGYPGQPEP
jgi:alpha-mannosidase